MHGVWTTIMMLLTAASSWPCGTTHGMASSSSSSSPSTAAGQALREVLSASRSSKTALPLPGVHDALSARIFAREQTATGGETAALLFLSGFGVSASRLGVPDAGLVGYAEMEDATRNVVAACCGDRAVVVVVDGDTGYGGGAANVRRTVRGLARAGAAAVTIEDQTVPKRCTFSGVPDVLCREDAVARIRTALRARDEAREVDGHDVLVVARTDCRAALGLEEVLARCRAFEALGADLVYAENLRSKEEYRTLRRHLHPDTPMILAQVDLVLQSGQQGQELYTLEEIGDMGYDLALFGVAGLQSTVAALQKTARGFRNAAAPAQDDVELAPFSEVKRVVGFPELDEFEQDYPCV